MQPFVATTVAVDEDSVAALLMDVGPLVMRIIRRHAREHAPGGLSVTQLRTLFFLRRHAGASLTRVAEFHGLTLSSTSKLVDGLVQRDLATRAQAPDDRRRVLLALTDEGLGLLVETQARGREALAARLERLTATERAEVASALRLLQTSLAPPHNDEPTDAR
jgi:DNA-binding MarR family transcriptional regulator